MTSFPLECRVGESMVYVVFVVLSKVDFQKSGVLYNGQGKIVESFPWVSGCGRPGGRESGTWLTLVESWVGGTLFGGTHTLDTRQWWHDCM